MPWQLAELELSELLVAAATRHAAEGRPAEARAAYEKVLRLEEWGIGESSEAGDQRDNAEETLRRWWGCKVHALFRLLCGHHDAGRREEADAVSLTLTLTFTQTRTLTLLTLTLLTLTLTLTLTRREEADAVSALLSSTEDEFLSSAVQARHRPAHPTRHRPHAPTILSPQPSWPTPPGPSLVAHPLAVPPQKWEPREGHQP